MSHTPGPWIVFMGEAFFHILPAGRPGEVASCAKSDNADLIASAPDLLAALQAVMHEWREGYGLRCEKQVRAAITKATTGEQP